MNKNRNVFLFGAGAVLDWKDAPSTKKLTEKVLKRGFNTIDDKTTITSYIHAKLIAAGYTNDEINFETIINVIEELIVYHSHYDSQTTILSEQKRPSLHSVFYSDKFQDDIFNYSIEGGVLKHAFRLEIPKGKLYHFGLYAVNSETPNQMFLQLLLADLLSAIEQEVKKYGYRDDGVWDVLAPDNSEINSLFVEWMKSISEKEIIRMYTLNYERNFKILLETRIDSLEIFEGFDCRSDIDSSAKLLPNVKRILNDFQCHSLYNLHGSIYWESEPRDEAGLPNPRYYLTPFPNDPINNVEQSIWQSEKGKTIMLNNIITGYQKIQKGIFPPFKQMQAALDIDCCNADNLYIVGYSFGDEHINASIRTALAFNEKIKVVIVDPDFTKVNTYFDLMVVTRVFSAGGHHNIPNTIIPYKLHSFLNGKVMVHTVTFKEFLLNPS